MIFALKSGVSPVKILNLTTWKQCSNGRAFESQAPTSDVLLSNSLHAQNLSTNRNNYTFLCSPRLQNIRNSPLGSTIIILNLHVLRQLKNQLNRDFKFPERRIRSVTIVNRHVLSKSCKKPVNTDARSLRKTRYNSTIDKPLMVGRTLAQRLFISPTHVTCKYIASLNGLAISYMLWVDDLNNPINSSRPYSNVAFYRPILRLLQPT